MGARWYNPATGSFGNKDTVTSKPVPDSASASPFGYAADNPLGLTDPTGHCPVDVCGKGINNSLSEEEVTGIAGQDFRDFSSGTGRDVWICPALECLGGSANHDYLTRSDWPTRARIVEDMLSEAQEVMLLRNLCDIALIAIERGQEGPQLRRLTSRIDDLTKRPYGPCGENKARSYCIINR
jgi:hypothetical protein